MGETGEPPVRGRPDDPGEHRVAFALRGALPTRRHGEMLFDMVAELLGASARVEASPDGDHRTLFRLDGTDPRWVIPWPLLTLDRKPRQTFHMEIPGLKPAPPLPPRPGKAPNLRDLGPGFISIHDGARYVQVAYAEDGRWFETSRNGPPTTLEGVLPVLAAGGGPAAERIAGFVAAMDVARHGPGRVFLPVPEAFAAEWAWVAGLRALRGAIARGAAPADARWLAADPVDGTALAWGATRDEALFAWSAEVERVRPGSVRPPLPPRPSFEPPGEPDLPGGEEGEGKGKGGGKGRGLSFRIGFSMPEPEPYAPAPPPPPPGSVPAALVPLGDLPAAPPPFGEWRRFLGGGGSTVAAAFRTEAHGWTVVGERVLASLAVPDVESGMDEADRRHERLMEKNGWPEPPATPETAWRVRLYRFLDEATGGPLPPATNQGMWRGDRGLWALDGDALALGAARLRPAKG